MKIYSFLRRIGRKLRTAAGETLTETLVSVLIISIVSVALAAMIGTATKLNQSAKTYDNALDTALSKMMENSGGPVTVTVTLNDTVNPFTETFNAVLKKGSGEGDVKLELYSYTYAVS